MASAVSRQIAGPRRKTAETLLAHVERDIGRGRPRLRGRCGAEDGFTLAATARTLRTLATLGPRVTGMQATT